QGQSSDRPGTRRPRHRRRHRDRADPRRGGRDRPGRREIGQALRRDGHRTASPGKHETVRAVGADHVLHSRSPDLAAEVLRLTGGTGADLVLESAGGATLGASLTAAKRVTGRVVVYGTAGGEAAVTNWELVYRHQVHVIGLNVGVLIQAAPQIFGRV